jgi:hypothetical protein
MIFCCEYWDRNVYSNSVVVLETITQGVTVWMYGLYADGIFVTSFAHVDAGHVVTMLTLGGIIEKRVLVAEAEQLEIFW